MKKKLPFGTGCIPDPKDERDYSYDQYVLGAAPITIDWDKGFDIRQFLGGDIKFKNQQSSSSCVGQGTSYNVWVKQIEECMIRHSMDLEALRANFPEEVDEISAKAIYSQIFFSSGGACIRDGVKLVCDWGSLDEDIVPSNRPDGSADETFLRDKTWKTSVMDDLAKILQGKDYRVINAIDNMDLFARAILENHGVIGGVGGSNNGTWTLERPKPPTKNQEWGHCLFFGAFGKDEFGKFIAFPNSWGNLLGKTWYKGAPVGYGWQKIYQSYFDDGGLNIFCPWTFTDKPNFMPNSKIIKDAKSPAVGIWYPAKNQDELVAKATAEGFIVPKKSDGSLDWNSFIQGTLSLK